MMNVTFEALKLKAHLECLAKAPTLENAVIMLSQIQEIKSDNFQLVQDVILTNLLTLTDSSEGL